MPDKDSPLYQYQKRAAANLAERTLITLERSQKLDLLIHLLTNLRKALIVLGPEGIGKTTLLQALQADRQHVWQICRLIGSADLSFESTITQLKRFLNLQNLDHGFDLNHLRQYCDQQKVVLIIDDAGELVPGLLKELIELSESMPGLRLVFAMTYDEFHIKSNTDIGLDECHFIEIPPLSLKQCAEYLQNLSAQPGAMVSFNAVTDSLVTELYRETHGIPGKILAEIPKFREQQNRKTYPIGLWAGVLLILTVSGWFIKSLWTENPINKIATQTVPTKAISNIVADTSAPLETQSITQTEKPINQQTQQAITSNAEQAPQPLITHQPAIPAMDILVPSLPTIDNELYRRDSTAKPSPDLEPAKTKDITPPVVTSTAPQTTSAETNSVLLKTEDNKPEKNLLVINDQEWVKTQAPGNYTLLLAVLNDKEAANRFLKKNAKYQEKLKDYVPSKQAGGGKHLLIYGSYNSLKQAKQSKHRLPSVLSNSAQVKQFSEILLGLNFQDIPEPAKPSLPSIETQQPAALSVTQLPPAILIDKEPPPLPTAEIAIDNAVALAKQKPIAIASEPAADKLATDSKTENKPELMETPPSSPASAPSPEPAISGVAPPSPPANQPETPSAKIASNGPKPDLAWIQAQSPENYTLQVMVLSSLDAVERFLNKYAKYSDKLKYYPKKINDQEKFVLIIGSFNTAKEAKQFKATLPGEFQQSLEKSLANIQKDSRR